MDKLRHLGIILDGNRRYAQKLGLASWKGHEEGAKRVKEIIEESVSLGVEEITLFVFSTENFKRQRAEVDFLMKLFKKALKEFEKDDFYMKNVRINFAGDKTLFPDNLQKAMLLLEEKTRQNNKITANLAMGYGGRSEILNALRSVAEKGLQNGIDEKTFSENLYIKNDVDLIVRTSGEHRLSGFLPWQGVYAELLFVEKYWPEFTREDLKLCVDEYYKRKRRFGQ